MSKLVLAVVLILACISAGYLSYEVAKSRAFAVDNTPPTVEVYSPSGTKDKPTLWRFQVSEELLQEIPIKIEIKAVMKDDRGVDGIEVVANAYHDNMENSMDLTHEFTKTGDNYCAMFTIERSGLVEFVWRAWDGAKNRTEVRTYCKIEVLS